jgi:hypothetical protein
MFLAVRGWIIQRTAAHVALGSPKTFQVDSILASLCKLNNRYFGSLDGNQDLKSPPKKNFFFANSILIWIKAEIKKLEILCH